jgi:glutathione S-transferase
VPANRRVVLYHAPQTRSAATLQLLEELKADYELRVINMKAGEQREPAFLAVNPMGKVPALVHDGALITEQGAIFIYLGDLYADAGLAPQMGDPLRGPYLRWLVFYGSAFEPAVMDRANKVVPANRTACPYGDFDTMLKTVTDALAKGPYLLGERLSAADVLYGTALTWTTAFGMVPKTPEIAAYIERMSGRPAAAKVGAMDAGFLVEHEAALKAKG